MESSVHSQRLYGEQDFVERSFPGLRCAPSRHPTDEDLSGGPRPGAIFILSLRKNGVAESVRLDPQVLEWLRSKGKGHLTRINDILSNLMEAEGRIGAGRLG